MDSQLPNFKLCEYEVVLSKFENCDYEAAQSLLHGWNKDSFKVHISSHHNSILHYSCYNGWKELSMRLIEEFELDPTLEDHQGNTSLHMSAACKSDNVELVKYLINNSNNSNPFQTNDNGHTVLDIAIIDKNTSLVHYLINECGCDQLCKTMGMKIMKLLYNYWDEEVARCLICDGGCQLTMENGTTLLHEFAKHGLVARVSFLILECNCDSFQTNANGRTVLDIAIIDKNSSLVHYLVNECGCDLLCKTRGVKIMKLLYNYWDEEVARCLICDGGCQLTMGNGTTLLHKLAKQGLIARVSFLILECKCDSFQTNDNGRTVLDIAIIDKNSSLVHYLINECGCDQLCKTMGMKIMKLLYNNWDEEVARCLICDGGCQLTMGNGTTLLHKLAKQGLIARVSFLILECKCDSFQTNANGRTALDIAIIDKNSSLVHYLINECGCDLLCKTRGAKIMKLLNNNWDEEVARCLICDGGCQVTMENGTTLLHEFANSGLLKRVQFLIGKYHCDSNLKDENGNTILHKFCQSSYFVRYGWFRDDFESLILKYKCNPNIENRSGETILHTVCYLLLDHGYREDICKLLFFLLLDCKISPHIQLNNTTLLHIVCEAFYQQRNYKNTFSIFHYLLVESKCDPARDKNMVLCTLLRSIIICESNESIVDSLCYLLTVPKIDPHISLDNGKTVCLMCCDPLKDLNLQPNQFKRDSFLILICDRIDTSTLALGRLYSGLRYPAFHKLLCYFIALIECKCYPYKTLENYKNVIGSICLYCLSPEGLNDTVCMTALHQMLQSNKCMYEILNYNVDNDILKEVQHHLIKLYPFKVARCILHIRSCSPKLKSRFCSMIDDSKVDLISKDKSGNTLLHIACECFHGDTALIEYIISTGKADPLCYNNNDETPMMLLANGSSKQVGVQQKVQQMISRFGKVKISHPIESYVNVVVLGNAGVGKSSLVKVINDRPSSRLSQFWPRYVKKVKPFTAGIIPQIVDDDKDLGRIILHDLAGQAEYYSSHTAVLENLLQGSAAVFILVVSLADDRFQESFRFWLTAIENVSHNALQHCQLLVVASHGDIIGNKRKLVNRCNIMQKLLLSFLSGKNIGYDSKFVKLDCRKLGGSQLNVFISSLSNACKSIVQDSVREMSVYCHLLYDFFQRKKESVYQVESLLKAFKIQTDLFLPTDCESLLDIIHSLSSTGLIVFLRNKDCPEKSWVVTDKSILLSDLDGVLFAPEDFNEHEPSLASNTGVVKLSVLKEIKHLKKYDIELVVQFLQYMHLCQVITEEFTNTVSDVNNVDSQSDQPEYIFVPALIKDTEKPVIEESFTFGWCIRCSDAHHFFLTRFVHIILLHLACKYSIKKYIPSNFDRLCKVWSTGIYWKDTDGVQALVEVVDNSRTLVLLMKCQDGTTAQMIKLIIKVIREILQCKQQTMPKIDTCEFIIDKSQLQYPVKSWEELTRYNIMLLAECYLKEKNFVVGDQAEGFKQTPITELFPEATYTAEQYLELLFAGRDPKNLINLNFEIDINETNSFREEHPTIANASTQEHPIVANTSIQVSSVSDTTSNTQLPLQEQHINSSMLRESDKTIQCISTLLVESNNTIRGDAMVLRESIDLIQVDSTVLNKSEEVIRGDSTVLRESNDTIHGNSTLLTESDDVIQGDSTELRKSNDMMHGNVTMLRKSDDVIQGDSTVLRESDNTIYGNSMVLTESDIVIRGDSTVLIESDDVILGNSTLTHSVTHDNTPYNILKTHTPVLLGIISDPDKLSDELWAKELLSDGVRDRIKTTLGISRYDKASMILIDVLRYKKVLDSNDTFIQFCDVLINHRQPGLNEIAEKMIALLTD